MKANTAENEIGDKKKIAHAVMDSRSLVMVKTYRKVMLMNSCWNYPTPCVEGIHHAVWEDSTRCGIRGKLLGGNQLPQFCKPWCNSESFLHGVRLVLVGCIWMLNIHRWSKLKKWNCGAEMKPVTTVPSYPCLNGPGQWSVRRNVRLSCNWLMVHEKLTLDC